jgi:ubiquinone/menaquinone biosynthesis C-methylase UbiE
MLRDLPFNAHAAEYDAWYEKYPAVFESELAAIRNAWPKGHNIQSLEIGSATGRFNRALNITEGLDPSEAMCCIAEERGVKTYRGFAEDLPYGDLQFDVVLMNCLSYLENPGKAFKESYRILKYGGSLLLPFIDKDSQIGKYYESKKDQSIFYRQASFHSVSELEEKLRKTGFHGLAFTQTLFNELDKIVKVEPVKPGYGDGSYILIKAIK